MSEWQPIETAPKDGTFLVYMPDEIEHWRVMPMHMNDGKRFTIGHHLAFDSKPVTHWMPLPPPPVTNDTDASRLDGAAKRTATFGPNQRLRK